MLPFSASGSGSPKLIFLHYFGGSRLEWRSVIHQMEGRFRCIAADAPGFGDAKEIVGYTVEEMTQHLLGILKHFESERIVLVGHSMMGKVSLVAASRRPANLSGLVLVAPSPLEPEPMTEQARIEMADSQKDPESAQAFFLKGAKSTLSAADIRQGTDDALRANPTAWKRWPQSGAREDWSSAIPSIDISALLLVGEHDPAIPLSFQKEKTLPHLRRGQLEVIPGVGHLLPYEAPQELSRGIEAFASKLA